MTVQVDDYYGVAELFTDEERMTAASVRSFVEREALPPIEGCRITSYNVCYTKLLRDSPAQP